MNRSSMIGAAMLACAAMAGCNQGTPGGPGTAGSTPAYGQADDTFNLIVPSMSSSLQQGEKMATTVGIKRAKNFDEDVKLTFADLPKGVTVEPATPALNRGDKEAQVTFVATDEATLGDFVVKVAGKPTKGSDAQVDFKLKVVAKDSFSLRVPRSSALKQGETHVVSIGIDRDSDFDQDVSVKLSGLPHGVTATPNAPVIKKGEKGADITLAAEDDAALGAFDVKVQGHPTKGADASNEFTLTVSKN